MRRCAIRVLLPEWGQQLLESITSLQARGNAICVNSSSCILARTNSPECQNPTIDFQNPLRLFRVTNAMVGGLCRSSSLSKRWRNMADILFTSRTRAPAALIPYWWAQKFAEEWFVVRWRQVRRNVRRTAGPREDWARLSEEKILYYNRDFIMIERRFCVGEVSL